MIKMALQCILKNAFDFAQGYFRMKNRQELCKSMTWKDQSGLIKMGQAVDTRVFIFFDRFLVLRFHSMRVALPFVSSATTSMM